MATSAEIQIAPFPTTEEVALTLIQWLFATIGIPTDYNIGSIVRTLSEAIGSVVEIEGVEAQAQALQALVYSAYSAFGISPLGALGSNGSVTFSTLSAQPLPAGQSVLIPFNSILQTQTGIQFTTTANAVLVSGTSSVAVPIVSVTTGSSANVPANTISQLVTGLAYPLAVTNPLPTVGGINAETPSQTLARFTAYVQSLGLCSPVAIAGAVIGVAYPPPPAAAEEYVKYSTCYDDQTEVLTIEGWYKFNDLPKWLPIATLNPNTHKLEYNIPTEYHKYNYHGELVTVQNKFLDLAVTPDHDMYVRSSDNNSLSKSEWKTVKAKDLKQTQHIKRDCKWEGKEVEFYEFGEYKISMDLWLEFLGYYISEGCVGNYEGTRKKDHYYPNSKRWVKVNSTYINYSIQISQWKIEAKQIIKNCLDLLPFTVFSVEAGFAIHNKQLVEELVTLGKSVDKHVPTYVKELSTRQLKIFLEALTLGDGMVRDFKGKKEWKYFTSSKKLADDVQEIVLKCGFASSVKTNDRRGREVIIKERGVTGHTNFIEYVVCIHRVCFEPTMIEALGTRLYDGQVYCVTVPNHIIYVRRNGKTSWCNQCYEPWIDEVEMGDPTPTAGFQVWIDNGAGTASAGLVSTVSSYLSSGLPAGFRPAGVPYSVNAVIPVLSSVVVVATSINPGLVPSITTGISQAITTYFNSLGFGDTAQITQLIAGIANVTFGQLSSLSVTLLNSIDQSVQNVTAGPTNRIILLGSSVTVN